MTSTLLKSSASVHLNSPTIHRLPNGLTIVAEHLPVDAVNLSLWLNVGSAVESDDINGMAHFLEHMIFKGTPRLSSGEFERLVEERGAVTNAATSQDYTHYYITTAPKDFTRLAPLQIDVVLNASIPDTAFERERLVVLEEIRRSEDNPQRRTYQRAMETLFETLPYRRSVLGPAGVIEQLTPQQMREFHRYWYQPGSLTAIAVGNLPVEALIESVVEGFSRASVPEGASPTDSRSFSRQKWEIEKPFTDKVVREIIDPSLQQTRLVMMWRVPGLNNLSETYALDVLASILGHGRTTRLVQDLREERGLVSSISVSNLTQQIQGIFYITAQLNQKNVGEVEKIIQEHLRQLQTEFVTDTEINRVRTQVANRFIFGNETPSDRANLYGYYQSMIGDLSPAFNYPESIQAITPQEIQTAVCQYLSPDAYGILIHRPPH